MYMFRLKKGGVDLKRGHFDKIRSVINNKYRNENGVKSILTKFVYLTLKNFN